MPRVRSFPPLAAADAEILILGSMPGAASLAAQRYYAHPHNAFWPIMAELFGFPADAAYESRVAALLAARIAVWDVLQSCRREGSLDTRISRASEVANDLTGFLAAHPGIKLICFNGSKAESAFRQHLLPPLADRAPPLVRLPSTSPAHATQSRAQKLAAWRAALQAAGRSGTTA